MSKRIQLDLELEKGDSTNDPCLNLRKKIKLEHNYIIKRTKRVNEDLDLTDHEVNKFLLIFYTLLDRVESENELEETDGIITDIILQVVLKISSFIRQNVETLPLPSILKNALKVIKELFQKNAKTTLQSSRGSTMEEAIKERPCSPSSSSSSTSSSNSSTSTTTPSTSSSSTSSGSHSSPNST